MRIDGYFCSVFSFAEGEKAKDDEIVDEKRSFSEYFLMTAAPGLVLNILIMQVKSCSL